MATTASIPSGKHTKNYGKSQFLMGKSTINGSFSIAMLNYQRVLIIRGFEDLKRNSFSGSSLGDEEQVKQFSSA